MVLLHDYLLYFHIAAGGLSLLIFWLPLVVRKGGLLHRRAGITFSWTMYSVAASALLLAVMDLRWPSILHSPGDAQAVREGPFFLLSLSVLVLATTRHGWLSIKAGVARTRLRRWPHVSLCLLLALLGCWLLVQGQWQASWLWRVFGLLQLWLAVSFIRYAFKPALRPREWWTEHLAAYIGSGIGAYTAFFVFGGQRFLQTLPVVGGQGVMLLLWLAPGVIGGVCIAVMTRHYQSRFYHGPPGR